MVSSTADIPSRLDGSTESVAARLISFACYQQRPLLSDDYRCRKLADIVEDMLIERDHSLLAFVFLPDSVHLLVSGLTHATAAARLQYAIKRRFLQWVSQDLQQSDPRLHKELTVCEEPGRYVFRFWDAGLSVNLEVHCPEVVRRLVKRLHEAPVQRGLCASAADWRWSSVHRQPRQPAHVSLWQRITSSRRPREAPASALSVWL